jgi:carbonic anhydrase
MEMYIVSTTNDSLKNGGPAYMVLGILFKMGRENIFLKEFLNSVPREEGKDSLDPAKVKLNDFFADISGRGKLTYYNYNGSLTTPPLFPTV